MRQQKVQNEKWQYQGGNNFGPGYHHARLIQMLPDHQCKILDVGSGVNYGLEKMIYRKRAKYNDLIDCVDRTPGSDAKPHFIRNHFQYNVENELDLGEEYDAVVCFEVMEHVDHTDILLQNCLRHLMKNGRFYLYIPNLSSIYARIELLLGYQPHILEVSNEYANFGGGVFGALNSPQGITIHHIRGITYRACKEMLSYSGFQILEERGFSHGRFEGVAKHFPSIAPEIWFVCKKKL